MIRLFSLETTLTDQSRCFQPLVCSLKTHMDKSMLNDRFVQTHRSYIVNLEHVEKLSHNKVFLIGKHILPIGRAYKKALVDRFEHFE